MTLTESELERYSRQLVLPEWSGEAQERLRESGAMVVGAGALDVPRRRRDRAARDRGLRRR